VIVTYRRGLPVITVPLPSRRELCRFTLRPVSQTVGDLLEQVKAEDRGVERAVALAADERVRIAASDTIESLLETDFRLIINDTEYYVKSPPQERLSQEEVTRLSDVRNLVNQLYEALNVREHQIRKERELRSQLEKLATELQPLEEKRMNLEAETTRRTSALTWVGLGLMGVQFGVLARLTWWEYSWDIMEPVTYFVTYGTAMALYAYFVLTKQEYILPDVKDRQHLLMLHKRAKKIGLDINQYNYLKNENSALPFCGRILVQYEVLNNSHVIVKSIMTKLVQMLTFKAKGYPKVKYEEDVPGTVAKTTSINCGGSQAMCIDVNVSPQIYSIENAYVVCRHYAIRIIAELPLPHRNAVLDVPVQIGIIDENVHRYWLERTNEVVSYSDAPPSYWEAMGEAKKGDDDGTDDELDDIAKVEKDLGRLRDPLHIHLPSCDIKSWDDKRSPLTKIKDMLEETSKKMKIT
ncbi:unnamed protein product, partial [Arctia plantaginis]